MNLSLVLKRVRHEWRQLGVLLISICLVTAFFALEPFYTRTTVESGLRYELDRARRTDHELSYISPTAFRPESWQLVSRELGTLNAGLIRIARSAGELPGFDYTYSEPITEFTPRSDMNYTIFSFSTMRDLLRIVEGRFPERLPPPGSSERSPGSIEEDIAKGIGIYSRGDVEAVITLEVAQRSQLEVGSRFVVGVLAENSVVIHVVGIVDAVNPDDPLWTTNRQAIEGEEIQTGLTKRYVIGLIVPEASYTDWIAAATRTRTQDNNNTFIWRITLNLQSINADNFENVLSRLTRLNNTMKNEYAGLSALSTLPALLSRYTGRIATIRAPALLLSGAILLLMLYHLIATTGLVLEQQLGEWSMLSSRGASTLQLVRMQTLNAGLLCLIGFGIGPLFTIALMQLITRIGPLAETASANAILPRIPASAYPLSAIAAVAAFGVLIWPAFGAARRSLTQFKQIAARPPMQPVWARYWLDLVLIVCGLGFIARLLFFISGDLAETLRLLFSDPRRLIELMLDSANRTGGLADPLNLLGPALLLTGLALFWLRLFPLVMRIISAFVGRGKGLVAPLSVWNVERDPGHYAQLVLLLIGTLALGTAALALIATRDIGAWTAARRETGADVRIDYDPQIFNADNGHYRNITDITTSTSLIRAVTEQQGSGRIQTFLVGIDPPSFSQVSPEATNAIAALNDQQIVNDILPILMSERMASDLGERFREDRLPLAVGAEGTIELRLPGSETTLNYRIVGITRTFPTLSESNHFLIADSTLLTWVMPGLVPNQLWLNLAAPESSTELTALQDQPGVTAVTFAWDRYNLLLREPLPAAIAGILYAGFWVSLLLSLLDFGFYLAATARKRSLSFAVLQALGWNINSVWALLLAEQSALVVPALLVGIALGSILAYIILPFLALTGGQTLILPAIGLVALVFTLVVGFGILLVGVAWWLRHLNVNQVLRLGEE